MRKKEFDMMKKLTVLAAAATLAFSATAFASDKPDSTNAFAGQSQFIKYAYNGQTYRVVNCRISITLRTAPDVYADEITQIPLGAVVSFIDNVGNGFFKVNYDGLIGYALASYLEPQN